MKKEQVRHFRFHQQILINILGNDNFSLNADEALVDLTYRKLAFHCIDEFPFRVLPFMSNSKHVLFNDAYSLGKIKRFNMGGCLFGAAMRGISDEGKKYMLIDHHALPTTVCNDIEVDNEFHPYESMMFLAVGDLFRWIADNYSQSHVCYHLPVQDYILHGMVLYLENKLTLPCLKKYINVVIERGERHKAVLTGLSRQHNIQLALVSPYAGIFDLPDIEETLLSQLHLGAHKLSQAAFVVDIKYRLLHKNKKRHYQLVWSHLHEHITLPDDFKTLARLGNSLMLAIDADSYKDFEICALLPIDERAITFSYDKNMAKLFGPILGLIWLPKLISNVNSPYDVESGVKTNMNNLYRFRTDLFSMPEHSF